MDERRDKLGFSPQKELVYNKLLPYSEKLDEESEVYLAAIKTNLGKSVLHQEIIPETLHWINHLAKYIKLYGRKFSKENHLHFINLLHELLIIPDLELSTVQRIASALKNLLKKRELLSREDLELPWRPLYDLYERTLYSPYEQEGMLLLPSNLENTLKILIRTFRPYFSVKSTQEMLEEWRPLMCPFDLMMAKAMSYFELFLCTTLPPDQHKNGFMLWFDEFMGIWETCQNNPSWETNLVWLFSRLARDNIGYIDWEPCIPMIFTRLLRSFNLSGGSNKPCVAQNTSGFDTLSSVTWIASMLGGESSCQIHISRLFKALESYYHPSNNGRWILKLQRLLRMLPVAVVKRLHRERHRIPTWETPIPQEYLLSDTQVTEFVKSLKPVALLSMFSKIGSMDSAVALQNLALLRPELIIPPVLDRLYSSLETLTEPHRLTAAMHCVVSVARSLVQQNKFFPEGPSHVIPLLMGALPGIDPNDIKKCMVTFQFISTFSTLILLVDSSGAVSECTDLTEEQRELCLATAAFEDFVLQFMDRCFVLIENSSLDNPSRLDRDTERMSAEENIMEVGLSSTFSSMLNQSSPDIYKTALRKLHAFVSSHIFEIKISGKYAANMCRSAARVNPELALQTFVPHFSKLVLALTESEDVAKEEKLDDELLFSLLLLSEVVRCSGFHILTYHSDIEKVLQRTLHLKCREGYLLAGALLRHTLKSYTLLYPLNFSSIPNFWNLCDAEETYVSIKDWGKSGNINNLGIKYHVASDEEMAAAQKLLEIFLVPELDRLRAWTKGEQSLTREEVQCSLNIVLDGMYGASASLPMWPGEYFSLKESSVPTYCVCVQECGVKDLTICGGENVRLLISQVMRQVLDHILKSCEDDTKSLFLIIRIYRTLLFHWGIAKEDFDSRWKGFHVVKKALENKLNGHKQHIRALLVDRTFLQNELRMLEKNKSFFTTLHGFLMEDLLHLSISHYSQVRSRAQAVLQTCLTSFSSCYKVILPELLQLLRKDPTECHEEFKGALYVILGHKHSSLLTVRNLELTHQLWPVIVSAKHSEKPSIIKLLEQISFAIQKYLETSQVKLKIPEECFKKAKDLWLESAPRPTSAFLSDSQIQKAGDALVDKSNTNERNYLSLVEKLVDLIENGNLHWRHYHLALTMLLMIVRYDVRLPENAVKLFVRHLVHDTLSVRKVAISAVCAILKQQKRHHPLKEVDPTAVKVDDLHPLLVEKLENEKPQNLWLQYNSTSPNTQEAWDKRYFVHKTHIGFYSWSKQFKVYAPDSEQPNLERSRDDLAKEECPVYDSFTQQSFVEKLISFLSLEERKGHDKFDAKRFDMFKGLFRNFGDTFLPLFLPHLKRMAEEKQESPQRCAAEIIVGLVRGSKHWPFQKMEFLKEQLTPILRTALNNVIPETLVDWATCIATISESRDPNKCNWIFELLMEEPVKEESGSFLESSWLYMLLGALAQQEWRVCELLHRTLAFLEPRLNHSYQNVREKMGSLLSNIFMYDVPFGGKSLDLAPKRAPFLKTIIPKFAILESYILDSSPVEEGTVTDSAADSSDHSNHLRALSEKSIERKNVINLFRTMCRWTMMSVTRTIYSAPPEIFQMLPTLCLMQSDTSDDGLQKDCMVSIAVLGQALLRPPSIHAALATLKNIAVSDSWHSRAAALSFLQVMVFSNLFTVMNNKPWIEDISQFVLLHLHDKRVEVRESAAETLGGFLHCEVMKISDTLLSMFKSKCQKKLKRIRPVDGRTPIDPLMEAAQLTERHAGILGLCACVNAFPYDVPQFMPDVLVLLGDHLHDPQPIQTTIKKTLSNFRRTHHDNWRDHKLKFTDDQLAVITDLLVSPSYYA